MSRSGYSEDFYSEDQWRAIMYRGNVARALRGRRGQKFLRELGEALDAMPVKELVAGELQEEGAVCALGAIGQARGLDVSDITFDGDDGNVPVIAQRLGIPKCLAREIMYENDGGGPSFWRTYTENDKLLREKRWSYIREWVRSQLK